MDRAAPGHRPERQARHCWHHAGYDIEHLYPHEVPMALAEFKRVLKPNGFVVITCPDLQSVCALIAQDKLTEPAYTSPAGPITPLDILYGHRPPMARGNLYMAHRCGFTKKATPSARGEPPVSGPMPQTDFEPICSPDANPGCIGISFPDCASLHPGYDLWGLGTVAAMGEVELRELALGHFP